MSVRGTLCARTVESLTLGERLRFGEVEIAILQRHHIKKARVGIVRGRKPVGSANDAGADCRAFVGRNFPGQQGTPGSIDSVGPGNFFKKGRRPQELASAPVQNIEKSVAVGLQEQVTCASIFFDVHQHGCLISVVVIDVVRSELEIPFQLPGSGIDGENACRIKIVAGPHGAIEVRGGVTSRPVQGVEFWIVGAGHPGRGAAVQVQVSRPAVGAKLPRRRNGP